MPKISAITDPVERQRALNDLRTIDHTDDSRVSILYYGHSFVQHMRTYIKKDSDLENWGFSHRQADIHYYSQSGGTLDRMLQEEHLWHIEFMRPDVVIIEISTNDLARNGVEYTAEKLAEKAHTLVREVLDRGVKRVVLNQVIPRGEKGMDRTIKQSRGKAVPVTRKERLEAVQSFRDKAVSYNVYCDPIINAEPLCMFWHHHNLWKNIDMDVEDGTHLNDRGHSKLIKSLKGAAIVSMKLIRPAWYDNSGRLLHCYRRLFARGHSSVKTVNK